MLPDLHSQHLRQVKVRSKVNMHCFHILGSGVGKMGRKELKLTLSAGICGPSDPREQNVKTMHFDI